MIMSKARTILATFGYAIHLHPFTDYHAYNQKPGRVINRAEHIYIYDTDDNQIMDAMSGLWCCSLGYSQPEIAEAVSQQFSQLPYYTILHVAMRHLLNY